MAYLGMAYLGMGHDQEAADALEKADAIGGAMANNPFTHVGLIAAYTRLGREQDARAEAAEVLRLAPKFSLETVKKTIPVDWTAPPGRHFLDDLREAGLK
jgi:adenylate cyclase